MPELTDEEAAIVATVRRFADERVRPAARDLEQSDEYPGDLIERMKEMGDCCQGSSTSNGTSATCRS